MSTFQTTGARATGLATLATDGTVLDTWFPAPELAARRGRQRQHPPEPGRSRGRPGC